MNIKMIALAGMAVLIAFQGGASWARPSSISALRKLAHDETRHVPTVLIVDDDLTSLNIRDNMFKRSGFQTTTARSGAEALKTLQTHKEVRLVVSDLDMPHMSGDVLGKKISEEYPSIPVILISYARRERLEAACKKSNAVGSFSKLDTEAILKCAAAHVRRAVGNESPIRGLGEIRQAARVSLGFI